MFQNRNIIFSLPVILWKHAVWRMPWNISNPIIAYMMITKRTRSAIWKSGIIAIRIAFKTIWRPLLKWKLVNYLQKTKSWEYNYNSSAKAFLSHMGSTYLVFQRGTWVAGGLERLVTLLHLSPWFQEWITQCQKIWNAMESQ